MFHSSEICFVGNTMIIINVSFIMFSCELIRFVIKIVCFSVITFLEISCVRSTTYKQKSYDIRKVERQILADSIRINNVESKKNGKNWDITVELINEGNSYMSISSVISGCSCIKTKYDKKPIKHLGKSYMKITYTPYNQEVYFSKSVMLLFNEGKYYKIIKFCN